MRILRKGISGRLLLVGVVIMLLWPSLAPAQEPQTPKVEIYGGYLFQDPGARVGPFKIGGMTKGFEVQSSYFFNKFFGLTFDSATSFKDTRANISSLMFGPTFRMPQENVTPFLHALVGLHRVYPAGGIGLKDNNGVGIGLGGGLDLHLNRLFDLRVLEADYVYAHHSYVPGTATREYEGGRLGAGLVLKLGGFGPPLPPPSASCSAQPAEVMAGEPVTVTATPQNFNPKATLAYSWTASGGKPSGSAATTQVDTAGLAPGSYNVTANVSGGKYEGKPAAATCSAAFTVKEPPRNPPTISCSANPTTVRSGEPSTITANAASPDNRPVNISYSGTAGRVSGSGGTATLDTAGARPGPISITCTATDDRGLSASANTSVTVSQPPPPAPQASKLNEITFKDAKRPARVDNEAKAILDDVALRLQRDADARAVVIGHATQQETTLKNGKPNKKNANLAAQRAVNTKDYLVTEKGIDPSRIDARTDGTDANTSTIWLVPPGASYANGTAVPEGSLKAQPRNPAHRPAAKKAAPAAK